MIGEPVCKVRYLPRYTVGLSLSGVRLGTYPGRPYHLQVSGNRMGLSTLDPIKSWVVPKDTPNLLPTPMKPDTNGQQYI